MHNKTPTKYKNPKKTLCKCVKLDILEAAKNNNNKKDKLEIKKYKKLINIEPRIAKKITKSFETTEQINKKKTSAVFMSLIYLLVNKKNKKTISTQINFDFTTKPFKICVKNKCERPKEQLLIVIKPRQYLYKQIIHVLTLSDCLKD